VTAEVTVEVPVARAPAGALEAPPAVDRDAAAITPATPRLLSAIVAVAGAGSLATEICASRLLAPYFGNSTVVWANVIGLILIYLAAGYWLGGRYADRHASPRVLGRILVVAALCIAVLPFIAHPVLRVALRGFDALSAGTVVGSFFATLALFSVPVTLLGMVSPFALRLALHDVRHAGAVSGRLSSLATMGAIAGTFLPALVTIPAVGTQRTMLGAALLVALAAAPLLGRRIGPVTPILVAALMLIPPGLVKPVAGVIDEQETAYQYVSVVNAGDHLVMRLDDGLADQSVYRPQTALTGGEWDMPLVVPPLLDRPLRNVLVIGNAGGTTARAISQIYPGAQIDGVELDPALTDMARTYFGLDRIRGLHTITADGRAFLETTSSRYDLIVIDAYRQAYIPFYLVTQEFFQLARDHLASGGAIALNVARTPGDDRLAQAIDGTLASVMPSTYLWPALHFNELVVGLDHPLSRAQVVTRVGAVPPAVASLVPLVRRDIAAVAASEDPMTDDRAPVEWLTDRAIIEHIARGGHFDETLLPTHP
jgi:spermidine synthase